MYELTHIQYKPGWHFYTEVIRGKPNLTISTTTTDSYHPEDTDYHTAHYFEVPEPSVGLPDIEWIFECIMKVEKHEAMEFYQVDNIRPFAPLHSRVAGRYYDLPHGSTRSATTH